MTDAFEGVRILDFTQLERGPLATQVLADFGAEVIKVERIDVGEIGRNQPPFLAGGYSPHWSATNRNKKSISVDFKSDAGRDLIHTLVRDADIVASNFRPGVMDKLGFGWETLSVVNPRIIVAYASGYGLSGPYVLHRGQDLAAQAVSGLMALTGTAATGPVPVGTFIVDYLASMQFAARAHEFGDTLGFVAGRTEDLGVVLSDGRWHRAESRWGVRQLNRHSDEFDRPPTPTSSACSPIPTWQPSAWVCFSGNAAGDDVADEPSQGGSRLGSQRPGRSAGSEEGDLPRRRSDGDPNGSRPTRAHPVDRRGRRMGSGPRHSGILRADEHPQPGPRPRR